MYQLYLLLGVGLLAMLGCKTNSTMPSPPNEAIAPVFEVSPKTQLFLKEYAQLASPKQPNEEFVTRHNLQQMDGQIFLAGFAKITAELDNTVLTQQGVRSGAKAGDMLTVHIPLSSLHTFFNLKGIRYFQMSEGLNNK